MNRIAVRIDEVVKNYEGDPARCIRGFFKRVFLEYVRTRRDDSFEETLPPPIIIDEDEEQERQRVLELRDYCLSRCMGELNPAEQDLFRRYFEEDTPARIVVRKKLAAELRLTANALRIKAHRIRWRLRKCMQSCLGHQ
jgi:DNA-directed RNA polymerase specialized sigma24 family protein